MTQFKRMKFEVTPETSPLVQKVLFRLGYKWMGADLMGRKPRQFDQPYLFTWPDGAIFYSKEKLAFDSAGSYEKIDVEKFIKELL